MAEEAQNRNYDPAQQAPVSSTPTGEAPQANLVERLNPIKLSEEQINEWFARVEAWDARIAQQSTKWDTLLKEYIPSIKPSGTGEDVKTNTHFRNVHTKMGQIFVKSPEVQFEARGPALDQIPVPDPTSPLGFRPMTGEEAVLIRQNVINSKIGQEEIDLQYTMDECLFDIQAWAGFACVKTGYMVVMKPIQKPVMQPDPNFIPPPPQPGSLLQLAPTPKPPMVPVVDPMTGQPKTQMVEVPIYKEWYAKRFSPKKLILNADLKSPNVEKEATIVGMKFFMSKRQGMRAFGLTDQEITTTREDKDVALYDDDRSDSPSDLIQGYELWVKGCHFFDECIHPQAIYQITLISGLKSRTAVCRPSPDQTFDPNTGQLTRDSLVGFPIKVGSNRLMADTPFTIADEGFVHSGVKAIDTHRRQGIKLRDAQIGKYVVDGDAFEDDDVDTMKNGEMGDFVFAKGGSMMNGVDKIFARTQPIQGSQDDYRMASLYKSDVNETLGISATQAGSTTEGIRSATEINAFQGGSAGRMDKESQMILRFYFQIVRAIDQLVLRYATGEDYVIIEGEDGSKKLAMWNKKILMAGTINSYSIKTDSQLKVDTARDRQQRLSFYNLCGADPYVNRLPLLRQIAKDFGLDPSKVVIDPQTVAANGPMLPNGGPTNKHEMEKSGDSPNAPGAGERQERNPRSSGEGPK